MRAALAQALFTEPDILLLVRACGLSRRLCAKGKCLSGFSTHMLPLRSEDST